MAATTQDTGTIQLNRSALLLELTEIYNSAEAAMRRVREKAAAGDPDWRNQFFGLRRSLMEMAHVKLQSLKLQPDELLLPEERTPENDGPHGYRKVLICLDKKAGIFAHAFVFGPNQITHAHSHLGVCSSHVLEGISEETKLRGNKGVLVAQDESEIFCAGASGVLEPSRHDEDFHIIKNGHNGRTVLLHIYDALTPTTRGIRNVIEEAEKAGISVNAVRWVLDDPQKGRWQVTLGNSPADRKGFENKTPWTGR